MVRTARAVAAVEEVDPIVAADGDAWHIAEGPAFRRRAQFSTLRNVARLAHESPHHWS